MNALQKALIDAGLAKDDNRYRANGEGNGAYRGNSYRNGSYRGRKHRNGAYRGNSRRTTCPKCGGHMERRDGTNVFSCIDCGACVIIDDAKTR